MGHTELRNDGQRVEKLLNATLEPGSRTQSPFYAGFWPWFGGVRFVFDLPTGQRATFSTGCGVLRSSAIFRYQGVGKGPSQLRPFCLLRLGVYF
jgi:hypothetical protein